MNQVKILPLLKSLPHTAWGWCCGINSRLRASYIESWRDVSSYLWKKQAIGRFYAQSLWLRTIRFVNVVKEKVRNTCINSWLTIRAWLRSAETWQNQVDDNSRLRNDIVGLKNEVSRLKQQRLNDENLILNLFQYHDERVGDGHQHEIMTRLVVPATRTALLKLKQDVKAVYQ
jgi:hypothetical protein